MRIVVVAALSMLALAGLALPLGAAPGALTLEAGARLLVIAPHPDDEMLASAGLVQRTLAGGGEVLLLFVTYGDGFAAALAGPPTAAAYLALGQRRRAEALHAARSLGGSSRLQVLGLGFPDGELGALLGPHAACSHPLRSRTTATSRSPYRDTAGAPYCGEALTAEIARMARKFRPTHVAFPDVLDTHADHSAVGRLSVVALAPLPAAITRLAYLIHFPGWPPDASDTEPAPGSRERPLPLPNALPPRDQPRVCLQLSDAELDGKARALAAYRSQQALIAPLMASFVRRSECFSVLSGARGVRQ